MKFLYGLFVIFLATIIICIAFLRSNTPFIDSKLDSERVKIPGKMTTDESQLSKAEDKILLQVSTDKEQYGPGDTVQMTVVLTNKSEVKVKSTLVMRVYADDPMTKMAGDEILNVFQTETDVSPYDSKMVSNSYILPLNLSSDNYYYVKVAYAGLTTMTSFSLGPLFKWDLTLPDRIQEDTVFVAQIRIINPQSITLKNIRVTLGLPFDVSAQSSLEQYITALSPGDSKTLIWNLSALSHSEVSQLIFNVTSDNGGNISIFGGIEILEKRSN